MDESHSMCVVVINEVIRHVYWLCLIPRVHPSCLILHVSPHTSHPKNRDNRPTDATSPLHAFHWNIEIYPLHVLFQEVVGEWFYYRRKGAGLGIAQNGILLWELGHDFHSRRITDQPTLPCPSRSRTVGCGITLSTWLILRGCGYDFLEHVSLRWEVCHLLLFWCWGVWTLMGYGGLDPRFDLDFFTRTFYFVYFQVGVR